jgi:type I restriction enzyme, S subunit
MKKTETKFKQTEIGAIPEEWAVFRVKDVAHVNERVITRQDNFSFIEYLDTSSVQDGTIQRIQKLKYEEAPSRAKRILKSNDTVISSVRPNLKHFAFIEKFSEGLIASTGFVVVSPKCIDPKYLYYSLTTKTVTEYLSGIADTQTSTFPAINPDVVEDLEIACPPLPEQSRIASILSSLDDKIELNRKINANLERIASALFKRWFVDFEFPNEQGKPYRTSGGRMVESELGEIPEGWRVGSLKDICNLNPIYKLQKDATAKYVEMKDLPEVGSGIKGYIERRFTAGSKFSKFDTLLARITPCLENGKTGFVDFLEIGEVGWGSTEFIVMHPILKEFAEYLYVLSRSNDFRDYAIQSMSGSSGRQRVQADRLLNFGRVIPSGTVIDGYHEIVCLLFEKMRLNNIQVTALTEMRNSLLPRLMSGRIRV